MKPYWALRVHESEGKSFTKLEQVPWQEAGPDEVLIEVHFSSINFKDALGATGRGKIMKSFPLVAGIDAAGIIIASNDKRYVKGQKVLLNGMGLGETRDGGYAEVLRVPGDFVVPLPEGLNLREAMILGTAGFTAALAFQRMVHNGQTPDKGPILITGASGGVGTFATQIFSSQGYEVHAVSGKHEAQKYLKEMGASKVIPPEELRLGERPLEKAIYGGAVDSVGGKLLAQALAHTQLWGNVAAIGMAADAKLDTTVMPFILRGVSLLGTSSANTPMPLRKEIWNKLGAKWKPKFLEPTVARTVHVKDMIDAFDDLMHRKVQGRILVEVRSGT